jgi:hypothetical protein
MSTLTSPRISPLLDRNGHTECPVPLVPRANSRWLDIRRVSTDAMWLLRVLIVAGVEVNTPIAKAWIEEIAYEAGELEAEELDLALG